MTQIMLAENLEDVQNIRTQTTIAKKNKLEINSAKITVLAISKDQQKPAVNINIKRRNTGTSDNSHVSVECCNRRWEIFLHLTSSYVIGDGK